ncbi:MAG: GtrA family protein [Lachnospiraceae bacterium]|nr:GtrA family protein [Lachnospiraceae bacterium]
MKEKIRFLYHNSIVRYAFFGVLTTLFNIVCYFLLKNFTPLGATKELHVIANAIAIFLSIVFAYVTNSLYVFESDAKGIGEHFLEFLKFLSGRLATLGIDVGGVYLAEVLHFNDDIAKVVIQFIVIVLNYFFSKFLVFVKKDQGNAVSKEG